MALRIARTQARADRRRSRRLHRGREQRARQAPLEALGHILKLGLGARFVIDQTLIAARLHLEVVDCRAPEPQHLQALLFLIFGVLLQLLRVA